MAKSFDKNNDYAQFVLNDKDRIRGKFKRRMKDFQIKKARILSEEFIKNHDTKNK
ncbi:MAG: hypothetical protein Rsou_1196 [Candidatus Ruthia sp. Asou_11_S2]|nr:hypothetical protein [Candidatus Ruthia sp. Asou_11_S2]